MKLPYISDYSDYNRLIILQPTFVVVLIGFVNNYDLYEIILQKFSMIDCYCDYLLDTQS